MIHAHMVVLLFGFTRMKCTKYERYLCYVCLVFAMISCMFIAALWSPEGLALVSDVYCDFVTFPFGILGQVWYLIV